MIIRSVRRRFPLGENVPCSPPFNKYYNLITLLTQCSQYRRSIDRIQISVKNRKGFFAHVKNALDSQLAFVKTIRLDGEKSIRRYQHNDVHIELITYSSKAVGMSIWFVISIYDPDRNTQELIMKVLEPLRRRDRSALSLCQVEFATDFYPARDKDLVKIFNQLTNSLVLKHSRKGAYFDYKGTIYQGSHGDVRRGNKGLRCYIKHEKGKSFVRIELQANWGLIRTTNLSLPIKPGDIEPFDYLEYREGLTQASFNHLVDLVLKHRGVPKRETARRLIWHIIKRRILKEIADDMGSNFETSTLYPVAR